MEEIPTMQFAIHNKGNIQLAVSNTGIFGTFGAEEPDPLTGDIVASCVYPKNSDLVYIWVGALWIGAVVGRDTLVTCGTEDFYVTTEYWPNDYWMSGLDNQFRNGAFEYKSVDENSPFFSQGAYSEQDIYCEYDDTRTDPNLVNIDVTDGRPHIPLNIKVYQRTMAWSYSYADDFILFDYKIENIGHRELKDVYMAIYVDGDVWHIENRGPGGWTDDITGFLPEFPSPDCVNFTERHNLAYTSDNDGDPTGGMWNYKSPKSAVGVRVIRTPSDSLKYSFNWWITHYGDARKDYGPRLQATPERPFRDMDGRLGTPLGDRNKYYLMSHEEFDYDLLFSAIDHTREGYLPPHENAVDYAMGWDTRILLSFGPFDIKPGEKLPITFAWVGGENVHQNPEDFDSHDLLNPNIYYNKLNFNELATNSRWASWVYDNPGVDTDGDGYIGKYCMNCFDTISTDTGLVITNCDTIYYEGDGVPDFRGASPPPAPKFWLLPTTNEIKDRFNGVLSETFRDQFSGVVDFEGYRIYYARDDRTSSYSLVTSYDLKNYNKFVYNENKVPVAGFEIFEIPFSIEDLRCLYGSSCDDMNFDPSDYSRSNPYYFGDSIFYFQPQDYNASELGDVGFIKKTYPEQPFPSTLISDSANADELTEDGYLKYFEYEYIIENILPTVPYYVNVTAFDFGSPKSGLPSLETPVYNGAQIAFPLPSFEEVENENLDVYTYPNPYRIDGGYIEHGFENRDRISAAERAMRINFANLPRVCKITIYSLDGDLIREIDHNYPEGGPTSTHDTWDLITRNTQLVTSGLYYWIVESEDRFQMGKLVIIM